VHDEPPDSAPGAAGSTPPVTPAPASAPPPNIAPAEPEAEGPDASTDEAAASPAWAKDLRKLYDAVVEEPLPESLIALLSQLDSED
jgi:hypothetical protein